MPSRLDPKLAEAHYWLGMANLNEGKTADAKPHFEDVPEARADGPVRGARPRASSRRSRSSRPGGHRRQPRGRPDRIAAAAQRSGRDPASVTLVAVSKTFGLDAVREAAAAGQREFGENNVQEALQKIAQDIRHSGEVASHRPSPIEQGPEGRAGVRLHPFGGLDGAAPEAGRRRRLSGHRTLLRWTCSSRWISRARRRSSARLPRKPERIVAAAGSVRRLRVDRPDARAAVERGSRADAPVVRATARAPRPAARRRRRSPDVLRQLSMGMSHDYEAAIEEGATIVRVGTAIFGKREARIP